jgi:phosphoenolpyruvate carboxykinase (GTP)
VALRPDNTVWWEDGPGAPPAEAIDWKGKPWKPGLKDENGKPVLAAHANSRYTAPLSQCPSLSYRVDHHHGVPIDAILFGGRRTTLAPLVYETYNWQHGVYVGATMASERTAAQTGEVGAVRRDPMAMLPFCGYNMADYFEHWLRMGVRMERRPRVFHVNWFRRDENGKFLWPGFGENLRVLEWILARCAGEIEAERTAIGYVPRPQDLMLDELSLPAGTIESLLAVPKDEWVKEAEDIAQFLQDFGERLPLEMLAQHEAVRRRLDILG